MDNKTKTCSKCNGVKPTSAFRERKSSKDGLHCWCSDCLKKYYSEQYIKNKEKKRLRKLIAYQRDKEIIKAKARDYYLRNLTTIREKKKKYRDENRENNKQRNKVWREKNVEHLRDKKSEWQRNNKAAVCRIRAKRRAAIARAAPKWADLQAIAAIYKEAAELRATGRDVHVDHVIPLQGDKACGLHVHWNLQILDAKANQSKGNRVAE